MRKTIWILFIVLTADPCYAQIPNSSFENWIDSANYSFPTGWTSYDRENIIGGMDSATVIKSAITKSGNGAVKIRVSGYDTSAIPYGISGRLDLGYDLGALIGVPFTYRISKVSFWTKYHLVEKDSLLALFELRDSSFKEIGYCQVALKGDTNNYILTQGDFKLLDSSGTPAYLSIIFVVGINIFGQFNYGHLGSWALIDDVELSLNTGVEEVLHSEHVNIIPNPSSGFVDIIINPKFTNSDIRIFDVHGQLIHQGTEIKLDVSCYDKGIYLVQITNSSGTIMKKLVVD